MWRKRAIALTAAVSLGVAAIPTGVLAAHGGGGGGGGHGGGGGGGGHSFSGGGGGHSFSGGRSFNAPGNFSRGVPGAHGVNRNAARTFMAPGAHPLVGRSVSANVLANRHVIGNGRYAWIGHHRVHGHHRHGFLAGIGYIDYWYYDDCIVWADGYGWINLCGYDSDE